MELEKQIQNILSMHRRLSPSITHHHPSSPISIHHHHHRHHHHLHHLIIIIIHHHPSYIIQKVWGCALAISIAAWPLERRMAAARPFGVTTLHFSRLISSFNMVDYIL